MGVSTAAVTIDRLTEGDEDTAQAVAELLCASCGGREKLARFLANPNNVLMVARQDDVPVGFALAYVLERFDSRTPMLYLHEIDVSTRHHREGIGRALVEELRRLCVTEQYSKMFAMTNRSNTPAVRLFESTGGIATNSDEVMYRYKRFD